MNLTHHQPRGKKIQETTAQLTWQWNSMFWPINAVILLGFTRKCGLRNTSNVAGRDCLSPATLDATHRYTPLSVGRLSSIFRLPPSTTDILKTI